MDPDTTDETLYSPASPMVQATGDIEQPTILGSTDQLQRYTMVNLTCIYNQNSLDNQTQLQSGWFDYKSEKLLQMVLWTGTLEIQHNQDIQIEKN